MWRASARAGTSLMTFRNDVRHCSIANSCAGSCGVVVATKIQTPTNIFFPSSIDVPTQPPFIRPQLRSFGSLLPPFSPEVRIGNRERGKHRNIRMVKSSIVALVVLALALPTLVVANNGGGGQDDSPVGAKIVTCNG